MRLSGTKTGAVNQYRGLGNQLWDLAGNRPSLDLRFADSKSLVDATTGTNLIDFTRASSGTYVGSDGLIKTATTNLLLYSESCADWTALQQSGSTVTSDTVASPTGRLTADTLVLQANSYRYTGYTTSNIGNYVFSVWLRADSPTQVGLRITNSAGTESGSQRVNVTTEWQRYQISASLSVSPNIVRCGVDCRTFAGGTGAGVTLYIWGAQLEQSSTVGEYIPTTSTINSAPRFDHDPTTGESLGLLVEESRTNFILNSSFPSSSGLNATTESSVSSVVTPDGQTSTVRSYTSTASTNHARFGSTSSGTSGQSYSGSCWVRAATGTVQVGIEVNDAGFSYTTIGTEWQQISATGSIANVYRFFDVTIQNGETIYLWGAQLEEGSFPTSYIPTTDSAVTRAADVASISGSNFSSWYRQDEGTVFVNAAISNSSVETGITGLTNAGETDFLRVSRLQTTSRPRSLVFDDSVAQADTQPTNTISIGQAFKLATVIKQNDFSTVLDGGNAAVDTTGTMPTVDRMTIGTGAFLTQLNGPIRRLTYWPSRLPNETLQTITQ